jgi:hypothetical protein
MDLIVLEENLLDIRQGHEGRSWTHGRARFREIFSRCSGNLEIRHHPLQHAVNRFLPVHELFYVVDLLVYLIEWRTVAYRTVYSLEHRDCLSVLPTREIVTNIIIDELEAIEGLFELYPIIVREDSAIFV